jgi:3-polyprenyl-4-hydroxybenzoate decarboxylase
MVLDAQSHATAVGSSGGSAVASRPPSALLENVPDPRAADARVKAWRLLWGGTLVVQVNGDGRAVVETLVRRPEYANVKLVVSVSEDFALADDELILWAMFTRFDCARDVIPAATETRGAWTVCRGPLGIDATWKQGYPEPVANLPEVVAGVDAWWQT